ncbi:GlsB/YeaQ/YmgE family stress response membrane protein [Paractinoplanes hotanensis]|uniref:GlsB/YeaQ/YmgE family stress response membrane protein n=1 Tax=Paractinoplanes hotanensis TaxID=2906497 RepID=A0ABT0YHU0_9ACTN|nr:GlsB/YeaQ/YmgE family stress response membrane protein [Actinoplanes hotanensis]MCM4085052.1 GlsB/YeaQ/YmgE family stress response membrane protein [Actinoplanes hotanensis]
MTVSGIVTAVVVGLIVGALGRLVVPGKQNIPIWLTMAIGVVAALLGTIFARAAGIETSGFSLLTLLIQIGLAALGVAVVAGTAGRRRAPRVR